MTTDEMHNVARIALEELRAAREAQEQAADDFEAWVDTQRQKCGE